MLSGLPEVKQAKGRCYLVLPPQYSRLSSSVINTVRNSVLWICIGLNADPDLDPGQILMSQKVVFLDEKYTLCVVGDGS